MTAEENRMSNTPKTDPERIDDDNPEWTAEDMAKARPAAEVLPPLIGQKATDERMHRSREQREWERIRAYGEARFCARLQAEGLDPDGMTEEEKMDYVDRVIHESREEERQP